MKGGISLRSMSEVLGFQHVITSRTANGPAMQHLLSVDDFDLPTLSHLLKRAEDFVALSRQANKRVDILQGRTVINLFFEPSTRTQASFEIAAKRLGRML